MGVVVCGVAVGEGHSVWGLECVGVGMFMVTFWVSCGVCISSFFCSKPEIFCFPFPVFANLTLEFCYDQTNDPGTLRIVLKDAYMC